MVLYRDALPLKDWERIDKGLSPIKEPKPIRVDPKPPKVTNEIKLSQISTNDVTDFRSRRHDLKNEEGAIFCGFDVEISFKNSKSLEGWIQPGDYYQLKRMIRSVIREENLREW